MQLQLRPVNDGRSMVLTDLAGRALPGQTAVAWTQGSPGQLGEATVTFAINGKTIQVVADPVETGDGTLPEALEAFARLSDANKLRFIEAARPHPLDRAFAKMGVALNALTEALKS